MRGLRLAAALALLTPAGMALASPATPNLTATAAIRAAMRTKPGLFSIFPRRRVGVECRLPRKGSTMTIPGRCATAVTIGPGYSGRITVSFRETWDARDFRRGGSPESGRLQHTWRVLESPTGRPLEIRSSGDRPPQLG